MRMQVVIGSKLGWPQADNSKPATETRLALHVLPCACHASDSSQEFIRLLHVKLLNEGETVFVMAITAMLLNHMAVPSLPDSHRVVPYLSDSHNGIPYLPDSHKVIPYQPDCHKVIQYLTK